MDKQTLIGHQDDPGVIDALFRAEAVARDKGAYYLAEALRLDAELRRRGVRK
jgi:hypothetical protein